MPYYNPMPGDDKIAELYRRGLTYREIVAETGVGYGSIVGRIARMIGDGVLIGRAPAKKESFGEALRRQRLEAVAQRRALAQAVARIEAGFATMLQAA